MNHYQIPESGGITELNVSFNLLLFVLCLANAFTAGAKRECHGRELELFDKDELESPKQRRHRKGLLNTCAWRLGASDL